MHFKCAAMATAAAVAEDADTTHCVYAALRTVCVRLFNSSAFQLLSTHNFQANEFRLHKIYKS